VKPFLGGSDLYINRLGSLFINLSPFHNSLSLLHYVRSCRFTFKNAFLFFFPSFTSPPSVLPSTKPTLLIHPPSLPTFNFLFLNLLFFHSPSRSRLSLCGVCSGFLTDSQTDDFYISPKEKCI